MMAMKFKNFFKMGLLLIYNGIVDIGRFKSHDFSSSVTN